MGEYEVGQKYMRKEAPAIVIQSEMDLPTENARLTLLQALELYMISRKIQDS